MHRIEGKTGFTLVELVTALVILGIVSVGITGFLRSSTQIFADVTERDQLLAESRFVVQRLVRELRGAIPNSVRLNTSNGSTHCIEFLPVKWASFYFDIPVVPDAASDTFLVVPPTGATGSDTYTYTAGDQVVVYPTSSSDIYSGTSDKRFSQNIAPAPDGAEPEKHRITLTASVRFAADSPSSRVYFASQPVSYCVSGNQVIRYENYGYSATQPNTFAVTGALMGEYVTNPLDTTPPFVLENATLTRNASVIVSLLFELNDEVITFSNEVHLANAP